MIIDTHAHIIVPEITRSSGEDGWRPHVFWKNGKQVIEFAGKQIMSAVREFVQLEGILKAQAEAGVDCVLLCPWVSILNYDAPSEAGLRTSRIQNEALAKLVQVQAGKVSALGTVPMQDPDLAASELLYIMKETGLKGVEVAASVQGVYLGDDRFHPFWSAAEETDALVFIHPTTRGLTAPVFNEYYLWNTLGNPVETTITAAHMIMAGVMERHPRLKIILAHGGGAILALRGRLRHAHSFQPLAKSRLKEPVEVSLKRFYYDTITHDADLLAALIQYVGPDHVLLGSDYPFDMGVAHPAEIVRSLGMSPEDEAKILGGNAARLLNWDLLS